MGNVETFSMNGGSAQRLSLQRQQNNEWCDIVLFGNDSAFGIKGHKAILASASPYLHEAFTSEGLVDSGAKEYHIDQIDHGTLQVIVDFIYKGTLRLSGEHMGERLKRVLVGADYLMMRELVEICGQNLDVECLSLSSAVNMWLFARTYRCKVLEDASLKVIASDLRSIIIQGTFLELGNVNIVALLTSLLAVQPRADPDLVFEMAVAWLGCKKVERKKYCDEIMRQIPLGLISDDVLLSASETKYLSEHVVWAVKQVQGVRAKMEKTKMKKRLLKRKMKGLTETNTKLRRKIAKFAAKARNDEKIAVVFSVLVIGFFFYIIYRQF